jgi:hypothetical protein
MKSASAKIAVVVAVLAVVAGFVVFWPSGSAQDRSPVRGQGQGQCDRVAATDGDDGGAGTVEQPFRTPERLLRSLRAGEMGCLRGGTYRPASESLFHFDRGGGEIPITLTSYAGERARLLGNVQVGKLARGLVLARLEIEGTGGANSLKIYSRDVVVEDSDLTNLARGESCMILGSSSGEGQARQVIVRRNRFHDCGSSANENKDHGIYAQNVVDSRITGNVFWNSAAYAIQLYPNAQDTLVVHNVIDGDDFSIRGGILFGGDSRHVSTNNVVEHNVIAYTATAGFASSWANSLGTGNVARLNCLWALGGGEADLTDGGFTVHTNIHADPRFVDRSRRDYRLGAGSGCLEVVGYDAAARLHDLP